MGAHFAAHDAYVERRNADFHRICAGLFAAPAPAQPPAAQGPGPASGAATPYSSQARVGGWRGEGLRL